jgi:hypothetical protein
MSTHVHQPRRPVPLGFTPDPFPEGTHICYLYSDEEERKRFMSEYVTSGLDDHESVFYLADTASDLLERAVRELGIATVDGHSDHLTIATALATYCPNGEFVPEEMLAKLRDMYNNLPASSNGARVAGEMTWATHQLPGTDRLVEYEGRVNDLLKEYPLTTLCQYDTRKFDGATIFELLNVHPVMIVHGQIMRNPFYATVPEPREATAGRRDVE